MAITIYDLVVDHRQVRLRHACAYLAIAIVVAAAGYGMTGQPHRWIIFGSALVAALAARFLLPMLTDAWCRAQQQQVRQQRIRDLFGGSEDLIRRLHLRHDDGSVPIIIIARADHPICANPAFTHVDSVPTAPYAAIPLSSADGALLIEAIEPDLLPDLNEDLREHLHAGIPEPAATRIRQCVLGRWPVVS